MEESSNNFREENSSDDENQDGPLQKSNSSCGWDRSHQLGLPEENKGGSDASSSQAKEDQKKEKALEKKVEKDAVKKLGISSLDDLMEYFEDSEKEKFL